MQQISLPSISVIIPTYNCATLLPQAIHSAYAQDLAPLEVIVVNDGCTDSTDEVIYQLRPHLPSNFVYECKSNGGEASARNRGISLAKGEYVAFLDQDDTWLPGKLRHQMELFKQDPLLGLTFTAYTRVSDDMRELVSIPAWTPEPEHVLNHLILGCCVTPSTVIMRREVFNTVGHFDESLWLGNDWDMWLRIAVAGFHFGYLPEPMTEYLWHTTNMSGDRRKIAQAALTIFPHLFRSGELSTNIQKLEKRCLARWNMIRAIYCLDAGEKRDARYYLRVAFRTRPWSFRPGWVLMYLRTLFGVQQPATNMVVSSDTPRSAQT